MYVYSILYMILEWAVGHVCDVIIAHCICPAQIFSLSKKCVNKSVLNKLTEF